MHAELTDEQVNAIALHESHELFEEMGESLEGDSETASPEHELLTAAVDLAQACIAGGTDPEEGLHALYGLDADELESIAEGTIEKAFHPDQPRDDHGQWVKVDDLHAAKTDPKKAAELKERVTDPEERKKLDKVLAGESDIAPTAKTQAKEATKQKRAKVQASREEAIAIRNRLFKQHQQGEPLSADDMRALIPHLSKMSHSELSDVHTFLHGAGAKFAGVRRLEERRAKLVAWAKQQALESRMQEHGFSAEEMEAAMKVVAPEAPNVVEKPTPEPAPNRFPGADTKPEDIPTLTAEETKLGSGWEKLISHALASDDRPTRKAARERAAELQRGGGTGSPYEYAVQKTPGGWSIRKRRHGRTVSDAPPIDPKDNTPAANLPKVPVGVNKETATAEQSTEAAKPKEPQKPEPKKTPKSSTKEKPDLPPLDRRQLYRDAVGAVELHGASEGSGARFDRLYATLATKHPALTPQEFKQTMRNLDKDGHIALSGWNESTDDVPDKSLNLWHHGKDAPRDSEDMLYYHANPASWHGVTPKTASPEASAPEADKKPPKKKPSVNPLYRVKDDDPEHIRAVKEVYAKEKDAQAKDWLEAALDNHNPDRGEHDLAKTLGGSIEVSGAGTDGKPLVRPIPDAAVKTGRKALLAMGAKEHGPSNGETAYHPGYHQPQEGLFAGDTVKVESQPLVMGENVVSRGTVKKVKDESPPATTKPARFETGKSLTPTERDEVLRSVKDVYKEKGHQKSEIKGYHKHSGDPIYGYPHAPEHFETSDVTGAKVRHYITLPDGRKAHPSELFPEIKQSHIDRHLAEQDSAEQERQARAKSKDDRTASNKNDANYKYRAMNRAMPGSYFAEHPDGRIVRVDGNDPEDVEHYHSRGFKPMTPPLA